jgi:hypothetical protein
LEIGGYGIIRHGSASNVQRIRAHRYTYELAHGPIPDGLSVLHNCPGGDCRRCVNPRHLWVGTQADNMQDMWAKGRGAHGQKARHAKLTDAQVVEIRQRYIPRVVTQDALAVEYGVEQTLISQIVRGTIWRHLL